MRQREKDFLIEWNYYFPLDRWWREKHNVAFLSEEHQKITQLQITYEYLEIELFNRFEEEGKRRQELEKEYSKGNWLPGETLTKKEEEDLFDQLDISQFND